MSKFENKEHVCCICGKTFVGYGNNPYPIKNEGRCCDSCNQLVIQERIAQYYQRKSNNE